MFYFFYKTIIFIANKEKDNIQSAYCKFSQLETVKPHCSRDFHASKHYENTLVDQSKRMYYPNYFINIVAAALSGPAYEKMFCFML